MPAPNHIGMLANTRFEELDDAPVDPVFDYEIDDNGPESTGNRNNQNRPSTPFYNRDKTNTSKKSHDHYHRINNGAHSRNTEAGRSYNRSDPSRKSNRDQEPNRSYNRGYAEANRNYSRNKPPRSESNAYTDNSEVDGYRNYPVSSQYGYGKQNDYEPEVVNGRYEDEDEEDEPYHNEPELERARYVYENVKADDLYEEEGFTTHKDAPLFRDRNHMVDDRERSDPYTVDDRYFDEEGEMDGRVRPGEVGTHRGKRVVFYRNGDFHYKGLQTSISKKQFSSIEALLIWLNGKISTTGGVRYVFSLSTGQQIRDIDDIHSGGKYVVSSSRYLIQKKGAIYGKGDDMSWKNKPMSAGTRRSNDLFFSRDRQIPMKSHSYPVSRAGSNGTLMSKYPSGVKPRLLIIRNNLHRDTVQKVILNPKTTQSFDEMIKDVGSMLQVPGQDKFEVTALYTAKTPYKKVQSFSQLGSILGTLRTSEKHPSAVCTEFIACGNEKFPVELLVKNHAHNKEHSRKSTDRYEDDYTKIPALIPNTEPDDTEQWSRDDLRQSQDSLAGSGDLSRYTQNQKQPKTPPAPRRSENKDKPYKKARPEMESITVYIHGNRREFFVPRYDQYDGEGTKPDQDLQLNWVYGYRGIDGHNNLYTLISGELLYQVASVAVIYDKSRGKQRHYREHTEDITCMAVLDDGSSPRVASGQLSGKFDRKNSAHIRIWDPFSMDTQCVLGHDYFDNAVASVSFSKYTGIYTSGALLVAIDDSSKHIMSVWDWRNNRVIAKTPTIMHKTSSDSVVWGAFHPDDHQTIITFGKQHIYFWYLDWKGENGGTARLLRDKQSGLMPINDQPMFVTSIAFAPATSSSNKRSDRHPVGHVITGDSNGCITVWERDMSDAYVISQRCSESMKHAHNKTIFALCMMVEGTLLSAGGGEIKAWDTTNSYRPVKSRNIPNGTGTVRTIVPRQHITSATDGYLYIGTTGNCILEGSLQEPITICVAGHSEEIWAVDTHPREQVFVSAGYDQYVTKWCMKSHEPMWRTYIEKPGMSVAFNPDGNLVVVGTTLGRFIVLNALSGQHVTSVQVSSDIEALDGIKFSPDGKFIAMGSHDGTVYIYTSEDDGKVYRRFRNSRSTMLKGHNNSVHYIDWSKDSRNLQTVSEDYDLLCWDITQMTETPAEMTREVDWATQTCVLNYNTLGAWSNLKEGEDITSVDRNKDSDTIAVGDNHGCISLYRYPCTVERPEYTKHKPYSGRINKLMYSCDDRFLVTSGGTDAGLMQWTIV